MRCIESNYLPIIKARLGCDDAEPIDVGFAVIKPDVKCGDVVYEIECWDRIHYGLGQALAYTYGGFKSGLIVIITIPEKYQEIRKFLTWVHNMFNIDVKVLLCFDNDCRVEIL